MAAGIFRDTQRSTHTRFTSTPATSPLPQRYNLPLPQISFPRKNIAVGPRSLIAAVLVPAGAMRPQT